MSGRKIGKPLLKAEFLDPKIFKPQFLNPKILKP